MTSSLLARCCGRPLVWQTAPARPFVALSSSSSSATSSLSAILRSFSSRGGGGYRGGGGDDDDWDDDSSYKFRRPRQVSGYNTTTSNNNNNRSSNNSSSNSGTPRFRRPTNPNYNNPNMSQNPAMDAKNATAQQITNSVLRTHMIELFPGNYDDDHRGYENNNDDDDDDDDAWNEEDEDDDYQETLAKMHQQAMEREAQKLRWIENSKPPVRVPVIDSVGRSYGRGGRKRAQARVWITPGFGHVTVNRQDFVDYFQRFSDREHILEPMVATNTCGKFDLQCIVRGGGLTGQAGAIRLGLARALQHWNPAYRPPMKKLGHLTRDSRKVERKKIGRVKARKRPQWNRR